jgi:hypothetical protein
MARIIDAEGINTMLPERKEGNSRINFFTLIYLLLIDFYLILLQVKVSGFENDVYNIRLNLLYAIVSLSVVFICIRLFRFRQDKVFLFVLSFAAYLLFSVFYLSNHPYKLEDVFNVFFGLVVFLASICALRNINQKTFNIIILQKTAFFLASISVLLMGYFYLTSTSGMFKNTIYYSVSLVPFLLMYKNVNFIIVLVIIVALLALLVGKRAALTICLIIFIFLAFQKGRGQGGLFRFSSGLKTLLSLLGLIIVSFAIWRFAEIFASSGLERMVSVFSDGGSGRIELLIFFLREVSLASLPNHLFGHGGTYHLQLIGALSVHNDFLEIYFRLGLVGLFIYLLCGYQLVRSSVKIKKKFRKEGSAFLLVVCLFTFFSMISMLIFVPGYVVQFFVFFALVRGRYSQKPFGQNNKATI